MNLKDNTKQMLILVVIASILFLIISKLDFIIAILLKIIKVIFPFILGIVTAFILNIPMTKIEEFLKKHISNKKAPIRVISIILSLLLLMVIIFLVLFLLLPEVIENIKMLISTLPNLINNIENYLINLLDKYPDIQTKLKGILETNSLEQNIPQILNYLVNTAITFISSLVSGIITGFTALVFSIYMLSQKEYLLKGTKKVLTAYLKPSIVKKITNIAKLSNETFSKFISGQCVEAVILGTIFFIVLSLFKFPYALIISVLTTITALIPIFGALIAMVIGAILIAIESPLQALLFIIIFQIIQQIEGNFIYPKVVGKSVGLSPIWTLLSISVGGSLFGIAGMLIALPLASILYALLKENVNKRIKPKKITNNTK